ncbi:MAG TPA: hypothetical protein VK763_08940 [Terriglobales bacterium]|jgi:hypothetical protein|nr:hypothetical protein [Terriglobales bacterium]
MKISHSLLFAAFLAPQLVSAQVPVGTPPQQLPTIEQKLGEVRYDLRLENGKFIGNAAPVLENAIANAQYVLIGEDHITREIPQFATAVCDVMAPEGLSAMAVEASPQAAQFVSSLFGKPDRLARMAALGGQYPNSVAFLDIQQENDLAAHCAQAAHVPDFHFWGLDQEFIGSSGWLIELILATHPGPPATALLTRIKDEEHQDTVLAKAGDPSKLFLFAASDSELAEAAAVLKREENTEANAIFHELIESREIYIKNMQGTPDSNSQRAQLMKDNFRRDLEKAGNRPQKVLLKFGDWHLYKGFNPLHQRDLGNYIAEIADGQGSSSLHICILGAKGTHRVFTGYDSPTKLEKFVMDEDPDYHWLKPAIDNQVSNGWTLYDLRKLRFSKFGALDPGMERMIYGYDLLVIVPELTPADPIQ